MNKDNYVEHEDVKMKTGDANSIYSGGAIRGTATRKIRFGLIKYDFLRQLAIWCTLGAERYGASNWEKGIPLHVYKESLLRHVHKGLDGNTDESHLIAAAWNIMAYLYTEQQCLNGNLPEQYLTCGANARYTEEQYLDWQESLEFAIDRD
jgi:hypothetical protein